MECRDVRELADSFLTGQLLVETNHELIQHLERCPDCRAEIAARRSLREKLRGALDRSDDLRPPPGFATSLAATLAPKSTTMTRRSLLRSWWSLAAGVVVAAGGGAIVRTSRSRAHLVALAREAAGDHQNCAIHFNLQERPIAMDEAGRRYGAPYTMLASIDLPAPLQVLERHACVYQGQRFGHVVFRYRDAIASLLVVNDVPPSAAKLEANDGRYAVASLPAGRFLGFVVAELSHEDVMHAAQTISSTLSNRLV